MNILIYHHSDSDGYLAASVASLFLTQGGYAQWDNPDSRKVDGHHLLKFRVGDYGGNHDEEAMDWADTIYVLDYCLPPKYMDKYFNKIRWIDHHQSSIDQMKVIETSHAKPIAGLREIGKSGCLLTWEWFYPGVKPPLVVQLVNDRDIWAWEFGDDTAAFSEASRLFMRDCTSWQQLLKSDDLTITKLNQGKGFLEYIRFIVDNYNDALSWEGYFEGHPAVFLNGSSLLSGEIHKRIRDDHPNVMFALLFTAKGDQVRVSLYRNDKYKTFYVNKIAEKYGGGGHPGAAGFHTDSGELSKILKESTHAPSGYKRESN